MIRFPSHLGALVVAIALAPADARADEVRLADGRILYGSVQTQGDDLRINTHDGQTVRVKKSDVVRIRTTAELREELDRLDQEHGGTPHAHLEIAQQALRYGLEREMWAHVDDCVEAAPDGSLRERLDRFLATLGPMLVPEHRLRAGTDRKVRALLQRVGPSTTPGRSAAIEAVLVAMQEEDAEKQIRVRARAASSPAQRQAALRVLYRRSTANEPFVWRTAVLDENRRVREAAMRITREADRAEHAIGYLAPGLIAIDARIRMRTAVAFAELGSPAGVAPIVAAGPSAGTATLAEGGTRGHIAILNQQAYVRDFEVEVAMASFIADPQIDVLQSGAVLDARVAAVTQTRYRVINAYRGALKILTGEDPGRDPDTWATWLDGKEAFVAAGDKLPLPKAVAAGPDAAGGPGDPFFKGPRGGKGIGGPVAPGAGGGAPPLPDGGIGGIGIPVIPGTLPPLPGSSFPPAPPPVVRPQPGRPHR